MDTIKHKRGTAANLTSADPVLAAGELCFETDTGKFKIGNGVSLWSSLPYAATSQSISPTTITTTGNVSVGTTATSGRLTVKGAGTTSGTTALNVTNSADASLFFVRNDGNIGINNNAPGSRFVIKGTGAGSATSALNVTNSSNTSLLFVQNDGKVGVGTATPAQKLDVTGAIAATQTVIGTDNILDAAATHACVIGGSRSKASLYGEIAHAAGGFTNVEGTAQHRILVARGLTLSGAFTVTIASPAVFTKIGHSLSVGDTVKLSTTGALPTGLNTTATYHVISAGLTADEFRLSTTAGGAAINTSGTQSGTHTLIPTTALTLNGAIGLTTPSRLVIPERSTWSFTLKLSAYSSQNNQGGAWWLNGGLRRNLTTTVELENVQGYQYAEASFGAPGALIDISADTVNNALDIRVTGIINQSVRWAAVVDIIQVSFGTP